jgi:hypothetical protein
MTAFTTWPSNFGLYTLNGNAAAASLVKKELEAIEGVFDEHDASIVTTAITNRLEALGHDEAWDTVVRDAIFAALKGETS